MLRKGLSPKAFIYLYFTCLTNIVYPDVLLGILVQPSTTRDFVAGGKDERHHYREKDGTPQFQSLGCAGGGVCC